MPQMSPLGWVTIFWGVVLLVFILMMWWNFFIVSISSGISFDKSISNKKWMW